MRKNNGFTLIELIITLSVAAILVTTAVPGFKQVMMNNRMATQVNELINALTLARSEAVKRKVEVTLCKSSNGGSCGATGWEDGWIVFINNDNDKPAAVDNGEEILRVYGALPGNATLRGNNNVSNYITYRADGFSNTNGTYTLCDSRGASKARAVVISKTGRPRIETGSSTCP